jgi:hypothetical protein
MSATMQELTHLRDPEKPHRRVFSCEDGTFVKVHAKPHTVSFGKVQWTFTGSHCDEAGKAFPYGEGFAVHEQAHELVIASDAARTEAEIAADFAAALEVCVTRVQLAVVNQRLAEQVFLD